jgi:hypothetical protein
MYKTENYCIVFQLSHGCIVLYHVVLCCIIIIFRPVCIVLYHVVFVWYRCIVLCALYSGVSQLLYEL